LEIIDLQLHELGPMQAWGEVSDGVRQTALKELIEQATDAVGVDGVVLFPTSELELAYQLAEEAPDRFASVPMVLGRQGRGSIVDDPDAPDLAERLAQAYQRPGVVGVRVTAAPQFSQEDVARFAAGGYDRIFAECQRQGIPVFTFISGAPASLARVAAQFPDLQLVLDHYGLSQPPLEQPDTPQWKLLHDVIALAQFPNVGVKLCGAPSLSNQDYPFADVWPYVSQLLGAFGVERVAWGSDIGRFRGRIGWSMRISNALGGYVGRHTYMESLAFFLYNDQLSASEKEQILGASARRMLKWPRSQASA
jgi:L-fuconolactonase